MPSMDAPTWWADVQQDRDNLTGAGRRAAEDWLEEDIDFVPRARPRPVSQTIVLDAGDPLEHEAGLAGDGADHPLHGVFIGADDASPRLRADEIRSPDQRRTVQIKGRPAETPATSQARRLRRQTASDRIGSRPDRIALWAVILGAVLIILAAMSSASHAAELAHHATVVIH